MTYDKSFYIYFQLIAKMIINKNKVNFKILTANLVLLLFVIYFVYHSFNGERGLFAYYKCKSKFHEKLVLMKKLVDERTKLEATIKYLHPSTLSLDFLDELARRQMGLNNADEKVIYIKKHK